MPEPQKMIHLTPAQQRRKKFKHPLLDNVPPLLTPERFDQLLTAYFETAKVRIKRIEIGQELIVNYFRLLRSVVARFLFHWPVSRRFLDEMISTGAEVITRVITNLTSEQLQETDRFKSLGGLIESRLRLNIEITLNDFRGVAPFSRCHNYRRERVGKDPLYGNVASDLTSEAVQDSQQYIDIDSLTFEIKDAIRKIAETDIEAEILKEENWGLSVGDLAEKLGLRHQRVSEVRIRLRERYDKLVRKDTN